MPLTLHHLLSSTPCLRQARPTCIMDETQQQSCQCSNTHQLTCLLQAAAWSGEELNLLLTQDMIPFTITLLSYYIYNVEKYNKIVNFDQNMN